jgi:MFS family permease
MIGVEYVGYWFVVFGVAAASFSFIIGFISKYLGRIPLIIIALGLSTGLNLFLLFWQTDGEQYIILYSLAIFYGIFQAIISTQMNCMYINTNFETKKYTVAQDIYNFKQ